MEPSFDQTCRRFTVVGTLEPRKNHRAVLDAFERLWNDGVNAELVFAGKLGWLTEDDRQRIARLGESNLRFRWCDALGDEEMVRIIRGSRATIYPALDEGYGLPPVESLALGVPVIVPDQMPSTAMLPPEGQLRMRMPTSESIRQAVEAMLDDRLAARKTEEICRLKLPNWSAMAASVERWIDDPRLFQQLEPPAMHLKLPLAPVA